MHLLLVHGTSVRGTHVADQLAFCGWCVSASDQAVYALEERSHVYFVHYGPRTPIGHVSVCRHCGTTAPVVERAPRNDAELMVDAFLDAHDEPLARASTSAPIVATGIAIACLTLALFVAAMFALGDRWGCGTAFILGPLGLYAFHVARFRTANRAFERQAGPRLAELLRLTGWTHEEVMDRADAHGYSRLRDYLAATWPEAR